MITPIPLSHLKGRARMQHLAAEMSLTADLSHLEPIPMSIRYAHVHMAIKDYYLGQGFSCEQWQVVASDLHKFNRLWRQFLRLQPGITPPSREWRFIIPTINNQ